MKGCAVFKCCWYSDSQGFPIDKGIIQNNFVSPFTEQCDMSLEPNCLVNKKLRVTTESPFSIFTPFC